MLPCDTESQLQNWPEQEVFQELLGWLSERDACARDSASEDLGEAAQFYVALPKAGFAEPPPTAVRSLLDIYYQFYLFTGTDNIVESARQGAQKQIEKAAPQRAEQLKPNQDEAPVSAAQLVDFVFIPRIEPSEKDGWYWVVPVTAVPSRILDAPAIGRNQGVNLRRVRSGLEPVGLRFLHLMHKHFANELAGGGNTARLRVRTEDSGTGEDVMPEQEASETMGRGLPYRIRELAYFDLQVQENGDSGGDPDEVGYLQAYYPILARFEKFWEEVERRRIRLQSLSEKALSNR